MRTKKTVSVHYPNRVFTVSLSVLTIILLLCVCGGSKEETNYFPELGEQGLYQRAIDLRNNLNVMSLAIKPGFEDLSALAYFRLGKGARIMSAYVTNGEGGESDDASRFPVYQGQKLREEAFQALKYLDGQTRYLNMPDVPSARDIQDMKKVWVEDSLRIRLKRAILGFKPDIIIIPWDKWSEPINPRTQILIGNLLEVIDNLKNTWEVKRVFIDENRNQGISLPIEDAHPKWNKTYNEIAGEAGGFYKSVAMQRHYRRKLNYYNVLHPIDDQDIQKMDEGFETRMSNRIRGIHSRVVKLTDDVISGKTSDAIDDAPKLMESMNMYISRRRVMSEEEQRAILQWKWDLENLRCSLQGIKVNFNVSDLLLTERQLTYITIKDIENLKSTENVEIYFTGTQGGWAVDESMKQRFPVKFNESYRLLTPPKVTYTYPPGISQNLPEVHGYEYYFYVIRQVAEEEKNFSYHAKIHFTFAPSIINEVLTPIVRMIPSEDLVIRMTNVSRDGVRDTVTVNDPLVRSEPKMFTLETNGSQFQDTLKLDWKMEPDDGTYIVPVKVFYSTIGNFVGRKFDAEVASDKRVGVFAPLKNSPLFDALRRLNIDYEKLSAKGNRIKTLEDFNVIILDRRYLSLKKESNSILNEFNTFVQQGGHLVILAQDDFSWNQEQVWESLHLKESNVHGLQKAVSFDEKHPLMSSPNEIDVSDWQGWLFSRGFNDVQISNQGNLEIPAKLVDSNSPLIVTEKQGHGKRTYVDLAFHQQWLNVHPGAYRLLANLISY